MMPLLQIKRIEDCMELLETSADNYTASQSLGWLIDHVGSLCKWMAFVNGQMAVAKRALSEKKTAAYNAMIAAGTDLPASLAKDYISSKCSVEQYEYDICERCSRTIVHTLDVLRTCISALKEEVKTMNYQ